MPRLRHVLLLVLAAFVLGACNTVHGLGADMKKAGEKIEDASGKH
jgi:predicted small secreted protein